MKKKIFLLSFVILCGCKEPLQEQSAESKQKIPSMIFVDPRDGNKYKIIQLGGQIWFAENVRFNSENSFCYKSEEEYCQKYGRLYSNSCSRRWANDKNKICKSLLDVCPDGWHIPTSAEWETLISRTGGQTTAGKFLKSSFGWRFEKNGIDAVEFNVIPVPYVEPEHLNNNLGKGVQSCFWKQTKHSPNSENESFVGTLCFDLSDSIPSSFSTNVSYYGIHPVRCIYELPKESESTKKPQRKEKKGHKSSAMLR